MLAAARIEQYEISNFARAAAQSRDNELNSNESRHNLKYWTRQPYLGFGVDAHSMLAVDHHEGNGCQAVRFATPDSLDAYMNRAPHTVTPVSAQAAIEESFFLGLRLNRGVDLERLGAEFKIDVWESAIQQSAHDGLLEQQGTTVRLTRRGRLLSNEVFARFLAEEKVGTGHVHPR
jgi:oxygen-independent coproporphyrinogen-3 oxidase